MRRFVVNLRNEPLDRRARVHHEAACRLLHEGFELLSPNLVRSEVGNVVSGANLPTRSEARRVEG